jgi:hypothetical protein
MSTPRTAARFWKARTLFIHADGTASRKWFFGHKAKRIFVSKTKRLEAARELEMSRSSAGLMKADNFRRFVKR